MSTPLSEAVVLGIVQGITEFLPVSSDGHLALLQMLYGRDANVALTVFLHAGTLAAMVIVFRKRIGGAIEEGLRGLARPSLWRETPGGRDAVVIAIATIPAIVAGLFLKSTALAWSSSPTIIGACLLISAIAAFGTRFAPAPDRDVPPYIGALLIGLAQGAAVLPGLSRSAMTLTALLWLRVRPERSFELAFLMAIPALFVALVLESITGLAGNRVFPVGEDPMPLLFGTLVAFLVGVAALYALRRILTFGKLSLFAFYLVPLAVATLAWGYANP